jgi:tRNA (adenine22-N1)-methyltransferase
MCSADLSQAETRLSGCVPVKLGARLALVAAYVPLDARLADIGTDHALLPLHLLEEGRVDKALGTDRGAGPLLAAERNRSQSAYGDWLELRQGDGLSPLAAGEADTLVFAGIGGETVLQILRNGAPAVLAAVHTLVIQPQSQERKLRTQLHTEWQVERAALVSEEGRIYTVLRFERRREPPTEAFYSEALPYLPWRPEALPAPHASLALKLAGSFSTPVLAAGGALLAAAFAAESEQRQKVLQRRRRSERAELIAETERLTLELEMWEEWKKWLAL